MHVFHCLQSTKMILKFREAHIGNMEKGRKGEVRGGVQAGRETLRGDGEGRKRKAAPSPTSEDVTLEHKEPSIVRNVLFSSSVGNSVA